MTYLAGRKARGMPREVVRWQRHGKGPTCRAGGAGPGGAAPDLGDAKFRTDGTESNMSFLFTVPPLPGEKDPCPTVVWLFGEQDISSDQALRRVLSAAIASNDADVVVDLSSVSFVSASTLGVIVTARRFLLQRSRALTVRSPSAHVRRIIGICGLDDLLTSAHAAPEARRVDVDQIVDLSDRAPLASR